MFQTTNQLFILHRCCHMIQSSCSGMGQQHVMCCEVPEFRCKTARPLVRHLSGCSWYLYWILMGVFRGSWSKLRLCPTNILSQEKQTPPYELHRVLWDSWSWLCWARRHTVSMSLCPYQLQRNDMTYRYIMITYIIIHKFQLCGSVWKPGGCPENLKIGVPFLGGMSYYSSNMLCMFPTVISHCANKTIDTLNHTMIYIRNHRYYSYNIP